LKTHTNFSSLIIVQVMLIFITCFIINWSFFQPHLVLAPFTFTVILIIQVITLIQFIRRSNKKLSLFMEWIKNEGLSERFSKIESEGSHKHLNNAFNEIIEIIAHSRAEKESGQFYFNQTLEAMGTSIISCSDDDKIDIFNPASQFLLKTKPIKTITGFRKKFPEFVEFMLSLKSNEQAIFKIEIGNSLHMLSTKCVDFKLQDKTIRLISFQDISNELANEELEVWQKMIKVLRHEIMNSVTPIRSLTSTLIRLVSKDGHTRMRDDLSDDTISNIFTGLQAIEKRNQGMLSFVESYQTLSKIKVPEFTKVNISDLFNNLATLLGEELKTHNIRLASKMIPADIQINADEKLIMQVLMNLVKNAIESLDRTKEGLINLEASLENGSSVIIKITDNGSGINREIIDQIFIPFFSTKKEGSGIGLSLSRQIMRLHQGRISVHSIPGEGTTFILTF